MQVQLRKKTLVSEPYRQKRPNLESRLIALHAERVRGESILRPEDERRPRKPPIN